MIMTVCNGEYSQEVREELIRIIPQAGAALKEAIGWIGIH